MSNLHKTATVQVCELPISGLAGMRLGRNARELLTEAFQGVAPVTQDAMPGNRRKARHRAAKTLEAAGLLVRFKRPAMTAGGAIFRDATWIELTQRGEAVVEHFQHTFERGCRVRWASFLAVETTRHFASPNPSA